jgi:hypothetical protein
MLAMVGLPHSAAYDADAPPSRPNTRQVDASSFFISVPFIGGAYKEQTCRWVRPYSCLLQG